MTDEELITAAVRDYFEGWFDGDVTRVDPAPYREYLHLVRTPGGRKIANALYLPL